MTAFNRFKQTALMAGDSLASALQTTAQYANIGDDLRASLRDRCAQEPDGADLISMLGLDEVAFAADGVGTSYRHYKQAAPVVGARVGRMS